jgi:pimeloyl-ACP methyl ester carboxylesterase
MAKVYFISGLGADKRVFSFLDLSFCEPIFIDWLEPLKNESLKDYALRLRQLIPENNPVIVGISLGGMLASEMAKTDKNIKAIIISSNKTSKEFTRYLKIARYIPVYKWIPGKIISRMFVPFKWILGAKGKQQKIMIRQIIKDTDSAFLKWAIQAILNWKSTETTSNIIQIHGTADKLLPFRLVNADYKIEGGRHLMPMDNYKEISSLLKELIQ